MKYELGLSKVCSDTRLNYSFGMFGVVVAQTRAVFSARYFDQCALTSSEEETLLASPVHTSCECEANFDNVSQELFTLLKMVFLKQEKHLIFRIYFLCHSLETFSRE